MIVDSSLEVDYSGLTFSIRLPWYRALPLSVVEIESLAIDGQPVSPQSVRLGVNGKFFGLDELPECTEEFWFVLDDARIHVEGVQAADGATHLIEVQVNLYPPYIPHLTWVTRASRSMHARDSGEAIQ